MFENLINTTIEFANRKKEMTFSVLSDLAFFFTYGLISSIILNQIRIHMMGAFNIVQQNQGSLKSLTGGLNTDVFSTLVNLPGFNAAFNSMLVWLGILMASTYFVYVAFQIVSWKFISKKKIKDLAGSFLLLNLGWIILFYLIDFLQNARDFILVLQNLERTKSFLFIVLFFILTYLAFISYSLIGIDNKKNDKKSNKNLKNKNSNEKFEIFKTIKLAFKKQMIISMLELAGLFIILNLLLGVLNLINYYAFLVVGVPTTMILLSFSKLHIFRTVKQEKI